MTNKIAHSLHSTYTLCSIASPRRTYPTTANSSRK